MTVVGSKRNVSTFVNNSSWEKIMGARYIEWLQLSAGRHVCQFETSVAPVGRLQKLSARCPRLMLLLDHEHERYRIKGLAKASHGRLDHWEIGY
jgi:hypothetical protein